MWQSWCKDGLNIVAMLCPSRLLGGVKEMKGADA
jgi:hypothetical protein